MAGKSRFTTDQIIEVLLCRIASVSVPYDALRVFV